MHDGKRTRTLHVNRLRLRLQATTTSDEAVPPLHQNDWAPPLVEHHFIALKLLVLFDSIIPSTKNLFAALYERREIQL